LSERAGVNPLALFLFGHASVAASFLQTNIQNWVFLMRHGLVPGHNVDQLDIRAGLEELKLCGYTELETVQVIQYAMLRWRRGEEEAAERGAINTEFHGISMTCWRRVLAAAMAAVADK